MNALIYLFANAPSIACVIGAIILAKKVTEQKEESWIWVWFLIAAVIMHFIPDFIR